MGRCLCSACLPGSLRRTGVEMSSWFVFTTNVGTASKSAVTVSAVFMVTVVLALLVLAMAAFASQPTKMYPGLAVAEMAIARVGA